MFCAFNPALPKTLFVWPISSMGHEPCRCTQFHHFMLSLNQILTMKSRILFLLVCISFVGNAQIKSDLIVHEWGTFTSRYTGMGDPYMNLHITIDEPVPNFVHHINFDTTYQIRTRIGKSDFYITNQKLELGDVSIKMETPVLYFYSNTAINNLEVDVVFPQGSISEFYPLPIKGENAEYVAERAYRSPNFPKLSFREYYGFAKWNINILAPDNTAQPTQSDESVPHVWLAPRMTKANMIESNGEIEKYIFYRGLGAFENPIIPKYTKSGDIVVTNNGGEIPYALVYEKDTNGKRYIWGAQSIAKNGSKLFIKNRTEITDHIWNDLYRMGFIEALVKAGLYEDEAEAMLNTWNTSYFDKEGIKVFWIVPRSFTDEILPISFSKPIASLERVMVGRTEIDTYKDAFSQYYLKDQEVEIVEPKHTVFPNPTSSELFIVSNNETEENVSIVMYDFLGKKVFTYSTTLYPAMRNKIPLSKLQTGIYALHVSGDRKAIKVLITE